MLTLSSSQWPLWVACPSGLLDRFAGRFLERPGAASVQKRAMFQACTLQSLGGL